MKEYTRVNHVEHDHPQDVLKTVAKGTKVIEEEVSKPHPHGIVIDNTNATMDQRAEYLKLAKLHGYRPVAFVFDVDKDTAMFLDKAR